MQSAERQPERPEVHLESVAAEEEGHLSYIDGLRAVAVLAVVVFHLWPSVLPGGFLGVDVFFVVSGFVVSASLAKHARERPTQLVVGFVARRCRRILPALMLCLAFSMVLTQVFIPRMWVSRSHEAVAGAAVWGFSNFALVETAGAYYEPLTEFNPTAHTWSLGVEEQFYLLFPWLFLLTVCDGRPSRRRALLLFGGLALASVASSWAMRGVPASYYLPQARLWELALGVLAQELGPRTLSNHWRRAWPLATGSCLAVIALGFALGRSGHAPWPDSLPTVCATAGLLAALRVNRSTSLATKLGSLVPAAIGRASYSIYLWHWPVFAFFRWTVGLADPLMQAAALVLTFAFATSSHRLVEVPARNLRWLKTRPWATILCAIALMLSMHATRVWLFAHADDLSLSTTTDRKAWIAESSDDTCRVTTSRDGDEYRIEPGPCQTLRDPRRIFVYGDSHARMLIPALEEVSIRTGRLVRLTSNCGLRISGIPAPDCEAHLQRARALILAEARPGDRLLLPALRLNRFSEVAGPTYVFPIDRPEGLRHARAWLAPLYASGLEIAFVAPTPMFKSPVFRCSDWFNQNNPDCAGGSFYDRAAFEARRAPVIEAFADLRTTFPGIKVWDPFPSLCPFPVCTAFLAGKPIVFDGDHLSGFGNEVVVDDLHDFLLESDVEPR